MRTDENVFRWGIRNGYRLDNQRGGFEMTDDDQKFIDNAIMTLRILAERKINITPRRKAALFREIVQAMNEIMELEK